MNNYRPKMVVGTKYKKLLNPDCANPFGPWDPEQHTLEDSAFGFIVMENGATITLEASWALNTIEPVEEGSCALHGTRGGAQCKNNEVSVNRDEFGRLVDIYPDMKTGSVAFYSGIEETPQLLEARHWIDAVKNNTDPLVLPEEACVVSEILEAIYTSAANGRPVFF
jgi:predicted dehydrogenase